MAVLRPCFLSHADAGAIVPGRYSGAGASVRDLARRCSLRRGCVAALHRLPGGAVLHRLLGALAGCLLAAFRSLTAGNDGTDDEQECGEYSVAQQEEVGAI